MFSFFYNKMTEASNYYVDWSRASALLKSGNHRYTAQEIMVRGFIVGVTGVAAYLGAYLNDEKNSPLSDLTVAIASGTLGMIISHIAVIAPMMKKRHGMQVEGDQFHKEIIAKIQLISPPISNECHHSINTVIESIFKMSVDHDKHVGASQLLGRRKNLLSKISASLDSDQFDPEFWKQDAASIIASLQEKPAHNYPKMRS